MKPHKMLVDKDYFNLQILFARKVAQSTGENLNEILFAYTDFYRRFELGNPQKENSFWQEYLKKITNENILEVTYQTYLDQRGVNFYKDMGFGCFSFHVQDGEVVFTHFKNAEQSGMSPLARERVPVRVLELKEMFAHIKKNFPEAKIVKGRSWLYNLPRYCELFPPEYTTLKKVETGEFQSMPLWGQFLDYNGNVKAEPKNQLLANLKNVDMAHLSDIFPFQVMKVETGIENFYRFYGL